MKQLYIIIGIPGSGKSYISNELSEKYDAIIVSSDDKRKKLFGDENIQDSPYLVFESCYKDVIQYSKTNNVIFDATNISSKNRIKHINLFREYFDEIIAIFINTPIEKCIERDKNRERKVNEDSIVRMYRNLMIPTKLEGFDDIIIINDIENKNSSLISEKFNFFEPYISTGNIKSCIDKWYEFVSEYIPEYKRCIGFDQNNPNHTLPINLHMEKANTYMKTRNYNDFILGMSALFHDIGKGDPYIKTEGGYLKTDFLDYKKGKKLNIISENNNLFKVFFNNYDVQEISKKMVDRTNRWQFLGHANVSAQLFLRIGEMLDLEKNLLLDIATIINLHMEMPFGKENNEEYKIKYKDYYKYLLKLRELDVNAK